MSEHYFTSNPQSEHDIHEITYTVPNSDCALTFLTDAGVFSRNKIDFGSNLLIKTCIPNSNTSVLDIGCGYGAIGLSLAARDSTLDVVLADVNTRAVELAERNAKKNILNAKTITSDGFDNITGEFDYIVFNPPIRAGKEVYYKIIADSLKHAKYGGELYIVIRKKQGGPSLQKYIEEVYGNCSKVNKSGGYWILKAEKVES